MKIEKILNELDQFSTWNTARIKLIKFSLILLTEINQDNFLTVGKAQELEEIKIKKLIEKFIREN